MFHRENALQAHHVCLNSFSVVLPPYFCVFFSAFSLTSCHLGIYSISWLQYEVDLIQNCVTRHAGCLGLRSHSSPLRVAPTPCLPVFAVHVAVASFFSNLSSKAQVIFSLMLSSSWKSCRCFSSNTTTYIKSSPYGSLEHTALFKLHLGLAVTQGELASCVHLWGKS